MSLLQQMLEKGWEDFFDKLIIFHFPAKLKREGGGGGVGGGGWGGGDGAKGLLDNR